MASVGDLTKAARVRAGYTQLEFARKIGVGRGWVAAVETDRIDQPAPAKLQRVADELGLNYRELLALSNQLGAIGSEPEAKGGDALIAAALDRQSAAIEALVEELRTQRAVMEERAVMEVNLLGALARAQGVGEP